VTTTDAVGGTTTATPGRTEQQEEQDARQFQYLVLRPFDWDQFLMPDELGERQPVRVVFTGGVAPQGWLPIFDRIEDALACSEDGKFPTLMLRRGRPEDIKMSEGIPPPCPRCGVIHWTTCQMDEQGNSPTPLTTPTSRAAS
jgi:hypothetical protein